MENLIGYISGLLVFASMVPYVIRVYQRKITPNLISWIIWTLMGVAILISYKSSGANKNIWPAVVSTFNPLLITVVSVVRKNYDKEIGKVDIFCLIVGLCSIVLWYYTNTNRALVQFALYIAIVADLFALIPTIKWVKKDPSVDRPFMWLLFSIGYGISIFAIETHTIANYILPLYMFVGPMFITYPLILYRIKQKITIKEWY